MASWYAEGKKRPLQPLDKLVNAVIVVIFILCMSSLAIAGWHSFTAKPDNTKYNLVLCRSDWDGLTSRAIVDASEPHPCDFSPKGESMRFVRVLQRNIK